VRYVSVDNRPPQGAVDAFFHLGITSEVKFGYNDSAL
jgi:hypothetical protein